MSSKNKVLHIDIDKTLGEHVEERSSPFTPSGRKVVEVAVDTYKKFHVSSLGGKPKPEVLLRRLSEILAKKEKGKPQKKSKGGRLKALQAAASLIRIKTQPATNIELIGEVLGNLTETAMVIAKAKPSDKFIASRIEILAKNMGLLLKRTIKTEWPQIVKYAFAVGSLCKEIEIAGKYGPTVLRGLQNANATNRGGDVNKTKNYSFDYSKYQIFINDYLERNPSLSYSAAIIKASYKFGCCTKTIQRHTTNPRSRKTTQNT